MKVPNEVRSAEQVYNDLGDIWNWAYILIAGVWFIIGVPGNLMIIAACAIFKEMHTIPMALAANLALSDLIVCLMNVVSTWASFLYDRALFLRYPLLCTLNGYICGMGCVCSIASICSIAINRYVAICHHSIYSKIYNVMTFPLHLLASWLAGLVIISPAVIEFQGAHFQYDRRQIICARSYLVETGYQPIQWWETVLIVPISTSTMLFTYSRIFSKVHSSSKNLQKGNTQGAEDAPTFTPRDIQLLKTLLVMFITFVTGNLPWFILMSFDFEDQAHHSLYYITVWTIHTTSVLNPVIYAAKYPLFQEAFKKILKNVSCGICFAGNATGGNSRTSRVTSETPK